MRESGCDEEPGFEWDELIKAVETVADAFTGVRPALADEIAKEASELDDGHEGKLLLLHVSGRVRRALPTDDLSR